MPKECLEGHLNGTISFDITEGSPLASKFDQLDFQIKLSTSQLNEHFKFKLRELEENITTYIATNNNNLLEDLDETLDQCLSGQALKNSESLDIRQEQLFSEFSKTYGNIVGTLYTVESTLTNRMNDQSDDISRIENSISKLTGIVNSFKEDARALSTSTNILIQYNNSLSKLNNELIEEHQIVLNAMKVENEKRDTSRFWVIVCTGFPWLILMCLMFYYFRMTTGKI